MYDNQYIFRWLKLSFQVIASGMEWSEVEATLYSTQSPHVKRLKDCTPKAHLLLR